jgi:hypothetical protein
MGLVPAWGGREYVGDWPKELIRTHTPRSQGPARFPGPGSASKVQGHGLPTHYEVVSCVARGFKPAQASCSQDAAGGDRWLLMAVRGHLRDTGSVMRRPSSW